MVQLAFLIAILIVSYALTASMQPKAQKPVAGQLDVPTATEGSTIPVCFGTNLAMQSNVTWYGNAGTKAIKSKGGKK